MKKLLLATLLATAAGFASAQSVELSGNIREFITDTKTGTAASVKGLTNDSPTSFTIKANEDLGGGLKARVVLQTAITGDSPTTGADTQLGGYQSTVGLANQFGSVDVGRQKHALRLVGDAIDPFYVGIFSTHSRVHSVQGSRIGNAVFTQANVGPVTLKYDYGFSEVAGTAATQTGSASATLAGVTGTVAYYKDDAAAKNKSTIGSLAYVVPQVGTKLAVAYSKDETTTTEAKAWSATVVQPVGQFDLKAVYGHKNLDDVTSYTVGVAYNLSKRTALEANYLKVSANTAANEVRLAGVGIMHKF